MPIIIDHASLIGERETNEDTHFVFENIKGNDKTKAVINAYGVFDGHSGEGEMGKLVSGYVCNFMCKIMTDVSIDYPLSENTCHTVANGIQQILKDYFKKQAQDAGTTCLFAAHYKRNKSYYLDIINVGDSRCIMCNENNIAVRLTKDHVPNSFDEEIRINKTGGVITKEKDDDFRIKGLSLSRSFGDLYATPHVTHVPSLYRYELKKTDKFVILGCDGLYEVCDDNALVDFVLKSCYNADGTRHTNNIAKKLAQFAIDLGSGDNVSVIVVFLY